MASGAGIALVAGCTGDGGESTADDPDDADSETTATGTFRLLISDRPNAIDHFDVLDVTFDEARVFPHRGDDEGDNDNGDDENEADDNGDDENEADDNGDDDDANGGGDDDNGDGDDDDENGDDDNGDDDDGNDNNEDDGEQRGFFILDLDGATVDLTEVVGEKAISVFEGELEAGRYNKIELSVDEVRGVLNGDVESNGESDGNGTDDNDDGVGGDDEANGDIADVKVPSEKLQIVKPFELTEGSELSFVFDINVVQRGQEARYNLLPVISGSGVNGEDVDVDELDLEKQDDDDEDGADDTGEDDADANGDNGAPDDAGGADDADEDDST